MAAERSGAHTSGEEEIVLGAGVVRVPLATCASTLVAVVIAGCSQAPVRPGGEALVTPELPAGIRIEPTELEGPVFADASGRTLYRWPQKNLRNGNAGDPTGTSFCTSVKTTVNAGLMSPYPAGLVLPDLDSRPACTVAWPPATVAGAAKPVGRWTIIQRKDGLTQWAYDEAPLYTSQLDQRPGDVFGGSARYTGGDGPANREPVGPAPDVPPGFGVKTTSVGRLLVTDRQFSVYVSDSDGPDASACEGECSKTWVPMVAPAAGRPHGDWTTFLRSDGTRQWAFRHKALYRYALDRHAYSLEGSDVAGWHNIYTKRAPDPPAGFTVQDTTAGQVLADARGMTIYLFRCGDDAEDQLNCDHPTTTQAYRIAFCGAGDTARCLRSFPYVLAPPDAPSKSRTWRAIDIDPQTGRFAEPGQKGSVHVWAYRDRPIYTYTGDRQPGDVNADSHGEFRGERNGFNAFWIRDDYFGRTG
jgi:predicted lipoprotein with Yx(FWY)xxD motif